jgi:two-component system, cell cycle sensor histidine kinase and response regulator CckA
MSIQRKLMIALVLTSTVPLLLTCAALIGFELFGERTALAQELTTLAEITGWNSTAAVVFRDKVAAERILAGMKSQSHILAACLYDQSGRLLAAYRASQGRAGCAERAPHVGGIFGDSRFTLTRAVMLDGDRIGTVSICSDLKRIFARIDAYLRVTPVVLSVALVITLLLSVRFQKWFTAPILSLARVALIVSERRDYSLRVPAGARDEVGLLIGAFNRMLAQIAQRAAESMKLNRELHLAKETAEKTAEALFESEQRFRSTFDEGPIGMLLVNFNGAVVEANRSLQQILGYSRAHLCRMTISDFTHPDDAGEDGRQLRELFEGRVRRYEIEKRYLAKDGKTVWAKVTVSQLHTRDGQFLALVLAEDVSEQKRLEEQFRQAQKMEAIGRLAGGVAHDFNNLLTVIKGNTELCVKRLAIDNSMHRNLGQVRKAADRAVSLVDQLLAFSRKQFIDPRVLDLNAVIRELEKMLRSLIGEDIELIVDAPAEPAWLNGDPVQLEQILLNLAVNARDAMPDGGSLTIRSRHCGQDEAGLQNQDSECGRYAAVSVEDTGTGMSEEIRSHIFEPFFTTKDVGKGTGLGLSTVYGLVRQAGGRIKVDTSPGKGSTFTIYFPLVAASAQTVAAEPECEMPARQGRETLLIVEDEELVRTVLTETMAERGYTVLEAGTPDQALELLSHGGHAIQLLVTDLVMPRMNGRQLAEKIRLLRPEIKVLYISGYSDKAAKLDSAFLKKPFTPDELARAVRAVLDERVKLPDLDAPGVREC